MNLTDDDIALVAEMGTAVVVCPSAVLKNGADTREGRRRTHPGRDRDQLPFPMAGGVAARYGQDVTLISVPPAMTRTTANNTRTDRSLAP